MKLVAYAAHRRSQPGRSGVLDRGHAGSSKLTSYDSIKGKSSIGESVFSDVCESAHETSIHRHFIAASYGTPDKRVSLEKQRI
jgi:hypothetical protein